MQFLKADSAITLKIGPFLDDSDGKTAETALTITQADVRLSKNGANIAQKNESTSCTHDELGIYGCPIDATDTDTEGRLQLWVHESGALPVWHEYMVVNANVFDSLFAAATTDYLQVDAIQISGDATAANNCELMFDGTGYAGGSERLQVDVREFGDANLALTTQMKADVDAEADEALTNYDPPTRTEATADKDAIITEVNANETKIDTIDTVVDAIKAKTDNLPTDPADDSDIDTQLAAIKSDTAAILVDTGTTLDGKIDTIDTNVDAILVDTGTTLDGKIDTIDSVVDAIKAKTDDLPSGIAKNVQLSNFSFLMVLSSDHITPATGKTVAGTISQDGGAFASLTNSVAEVANGIYKVTITQAEMNADIIVLRFTNADCDSRLITITTS